MSDRLNEKELRAKMRRLARALVRYREQLEARHAADPLKPPPLFLLNAVITSLERETQ